MFCFVNSRLTSPCSQRDFILSITFLIKFFPAQLIHNIYSSHLYALWLIGVLHTFTHGSPLILLIKLKNAEIAYHLFTSQKPKLRNAIQLTWGDLGLDTKLSEYFLK